MRPVHRRSISGRSSSDGSVAVVGVVVYSFFPGVNHGLWRMEDLSTKLLLCLRDNWKNPQISMQSSEVWIPQPNEAGCALARTPAQTGLAGRERLISLEISKPLWSWSLPLQAAGRRRGDPGSGLSLVVFPIKERRRLEPLPAATTV